MNNNFDISSSVTVKVKNELNSNAIIQFINDLDISYIISCMEDITDLQSLVTVSWPTDLYSTVNPRVKGNSDLMSVAQSSKFRDLTSKGYNPYSADLTGYTSITDMSTMDIIFTLIQARFHRRNCGAIQDAYIRESRPTINYGTAQSLLVGNLLDGEYESLIQFDTSAFLSLDKNTSVILGANLVLHLIGTYDPKLIIDVYEITSNWTESSVTWYNFGQGTNLITSFNCNSTVVKVDLLSYLNDLKSKGLSKVNLQFKVRGADTTTLLYFESHDSTNTANRPYIEIKYQDSTWTGYTGSTDLNASATLRVTNSKDLSSVAKLRAEATNDLDSKATKRQTNNTNITSSTTVRQVGYTDLLSNGQALPNKDLLSLGTVRQTDYKDLQSSTNVYIKSDIDGYASIKTTNAWLVGSARIRRTTFNDLNSIANIRHNIDLPSSAIKRLTKVSDITSKATIRATKTSDLNSLATIRQYVDLISKAIIEKTAYKDLPSTGKSRWTTQTDLDSKITVRGSYDDKTGSVTIRRTTNTNLNSFSYSAFGSMIDSNATIKSTVKIGTNDLDSTTRVRLKGNTDLTSKVNIYNVINLLSTAVVRKLATSDLNSKVTINQITDLISNAQPHQIKDLVSSVVVRLTNKIDLVSNAVIKQFDINELDSIAYLYGMETLDLTCKVMVQRHGVDYLDSKAEIRTTARRWVPNVQGVEQFNFEDRKLPRVWKRENFIS